MLTRRTVSLIIIVCFVFAQLMGKGALSAEAQASHTTSPRAQSRFATGVATAGPESPEYQDVQHRLATGWNTWDVNSAATEVLLPEGLAIHVGLRLNGTLWKGQFLQDAQTDDPGTIPGRHSWNGSYSDMRIAWQGHDWRIQSAHEGGDLVLLASPLPDKQPSFLPPTIIFSVDFLWNLPGTALKHSDFIETHSASGAVPIFCTCNPSKAHSEATPEKDYINIPIGGPYFSADFIQPVGVSTGKRRTLAEIEAIMNRQQEAYQQSITSAGQNGPILDAIESTLGWNTTYDPTKHRVISPVSRTWAVQWGGFVLFDWDTFFAATLAGIRDRDLAYANAIEILREETPQGFVPNYAHPDGWKSFDRSEPPVGAITVLGLYQQYHDRWFLKEAFPPLLRWNRWWSEHRDTQGYLAWGSDGENQPESMDDSSRGTRAGAIFESGLDNSPMYDSAVYNSQSHLLEYADVGLMSMYIADCDALAHIAEILNMPAEAKELKERSTRYRLKLATLWNEQAGIFLNKDLHTGQFSYRLSPTNFYPMLARAATPAQASIMVEKHLLNPQEFWGEWIIPSIARNDTAFHDQNYWRGRIWGPMNYLVYLGLRNYDDADTRREFAQKSYNLFLKEWTEKSHVHENYNAILGSGDDVANSSRFYHWGALLGYIEYLEQYQTAQPLKPLK